MKMRLHIQLGVLACLPELERAHANPWRNLSTNHPCHLADLLWAVPPAVFPPFLFIDEGEGEMR